MRAGCQRPRNRYTCAAEDITYIPTSLGRRVAHHKKISQYRGEPLVIPNADLSNDTRDLLKSEVQAAKNAAEMALIVEKAGQTGNLSALLSGLDAGSLTEGTGITEDDLKVALGSTNNDFRALAVNQPLPVEQAQKFMSSTTRRGIVPDTGVG